MGFYDINFTDEDVIQNISVQEVLALRDYKDRKLYLRDEVNEYSVIGVINSIIAYNKDDEGIPIDERRPIRLFCTSRGGSVDDGFELINAIIFSKTPVYTINLGYQYSMSFLIGIAGHKRFSAPHAKFLIHDGSMAQYGTYGKVIDAVEFHKKEEGVIKDFVLSRTKITEDMYDSNKRTEWYMYGYEAKELGVTDYILGVDCDIDDISGGKYEGN